MKRSSRNIMTVFLLMTAVPTQIFANTATNSPATEIANPKSEADVAAMEKRLNEIKAMDFSQLSRAEKKALRKEVKQIEQTMAIGGGIYISVGALIIIILLLIIIF